MALELALRERIPPTSLGHTVRRGKDRWLRAICALCGMGSVLPLLAWALGWGSFQLWFIAVGVPSQVTLITVGLGVRATLHARIHTALRAGVVGGIVGTFGYDLVRVPFEVAGMRVFLPIDSYGILMLGAHTSTPLTEFSGWAYHFMNGVGFGVTYACVALGRRWFWAVPWALFLETMFIVTPLGRLYDIQGQWVPITAAYVGHVAYGVPLGVIAEQAGRASRVKVPIPASWALGGALIFLLAVHQPFVSSAADTAGRALSATTASAVIQDGKFHPQWLHPAAGRCAVVRNDDHTAYQLSGLPQTLSLPPGATADLCLSRAGITRVRTRAVPFSGGVVLIDPGSNQ